MDILKWMSRCMLVCAALFLWAAQAAWAVDDSVITNAEGQAAGYRATLEGIQREFLNAYLGSDRLTELRLKLEDLRAQTLDTTGSLASPLAEIAQQIDKLGPAPANGASEAESIAAQRQLLNSEQLRLQGTSKQLELIVVEIDQLVARAAAMQRESFFSEIFQSGRTVLNPLLWYDGLTGVGEFLQRLAILLADWWRTAASADLPHLVLIPLIGILSFVALRAGRRWLAAKLKMAPPDGQQPDDLNRLRRTIRGPVLTGFLVLAAALVIYKVANEARVITPSIAPILNALAVFVLYAASSISLIQRMTSPRLAAWRVLNLDDQAAQRIFVLISIAAIATANEFAIKGMADETFVPIGLLVALSAMTAIILIAVVALVLVTLRQQKGLGVRRNFYFGWVVQAIPAVWMTLLVAGIALLLGYIALGDFLVTKIYETSLAIVALTIAHHLAELAIAASTDPLNRSGRLLRSVTGLGERGIDRLGLLVRTLIDVGLVFIGIPLLLVIWTITWIDIRSLVNTAFFGFRVGSIMIAPSALFLAVAILALGIFITKLIARWLDTRILTQTRLDKGLQDSIRTGAGYAGYVMAIGFALTAAGLDFSNIAIVAGALGVGIGFGLQSIVNNFVSGLILLAERPVRVGDWIKIGNDEGIVKKINVRSTEIETFDSCAVIVPNSNLVTLPVRNWTYADTMGQFLVTLQVSYKASPEIVRDLLLRLAREHSLVLTYPAPSVTLAQFGASGLSFELRGQVADVLTAGGVASDLRFSILKAFKGEGIELAIPLQDVRFLNLPQPTAVESKPQAT